MKNIKWNKKLIMLSIAGIVLVTSPVVTEGKTKAKIEENYQEEDVIKYFDNLKDKTIDLIDEGKNEEKVEKNMTTYINFIFEDKKIKNHTIKDLTDKNQNEIKTDFVCLKEYIEEKRPTWYEKLTEVSKEVKDYLVYGYQEIKDQLTEWKEEGTLKENLKKEFKEQLEQDKDTLKNAWNKVKQLIK